MNTSILILFVACLLFSGFSFLVNSKVRYDQWLKILTVLFGLLGLLGAGYLLVISFISYIGL